jgi:hypothetical protein
MNIETVKAHDKLSSQPNGTPRHATPRHFNPIPYYASLFAVPSYPPPLQPLLPPPQSQSHTILFRYIIRYKNNSDLFRAEREVGGTGHGARGTEPTVSPDIAPALPVGRGSDPER